MVVRLVITGDVQGVGYRYSMFYAAKNYGLTGWVRNRSDGTVEAVVQGPENKVDEFVRWAWKGPSLCKVTNIEIIPAEGEFSNFEIMPTL